jgi:hypothetical protein
VIIKREREKNNRTCMEMTVSHVPVGTRVSKMQEIPPVIMDTKINNRLPENFSITTMHSV